MTDIKLASRSYTQTLSPKQLLAQLRSVAATTLQAHASSSSSQSPSPSSNLLMSNLIALAKSMPDRDVERKVTRICIYLVLSMPSTPPGYEFPDQLQENLFSFLGLEAKKQNAESGARQAFAIKHLGRIAGMCSHLEEAINTVSQLLLRAKYPTRRKAMILGLGQKKADREYDTALQVWNSLLISLRFCCRRGGSNDTDKKEEEWDGTAAPPLNLGRDFDEPLLTAVQSVDSPCLARHAAALLIESAVTADTTTELASKLLSRMATVNTQDSLCCSYLIRTCMEVSKGNSINVAAQLWTALYEQLSGRMTAIGKSGEVQGLKLCADFMAGLCECPHAWAMLDIPAHLVQALSQYTQSLPTAHYAIPVALRAVARLGRFVLSASPSSSRNFHDELEKLAAVVRASLDAMVLPETVSEPTSRARSSSSSSSPPPIANVESGFAATQTLASSFPNAFLDSLVASLWMLPRTFSSSEAILDSFYRHLQGAERVLGEGLSLRLLDALLARTKVSVEQGCDELLPHLLGLAQRLLREFGSVQCVMNLVKVWSWVSSLVLVLGESTVNVDRRLSFKRQLCVSVLAIINDEYTGAEAVAPNFLAQSDARARGYWVLAEHVLACLPLPRAAITSLSPSSSSHVDLWQLSETILVLLRGAAIETGASRVLCEAGLSKLLLRLHVYARVSGSRQHTAARLYLTNRIRDVLARSTAVASSKQHSGLANTHPSRWTFASLDCLSQLQAAPAINHSGTDLESRECAVCLPLDSTWDAWRKSLHFSDEAEADSYQRDGQTLLRIDTSTSLLSYNEQRARELPLFADVFTPIPPLTLPAPLLTDDEGPLLPFAFSSDLSPPPPPSSSAPAAPPKPLKAGVDFAPPSPTTPAPNQPPKPVRSSIRSDEAFPAAAAAAAAAVSTSSPPPAHAAVLSSSPPKPSRPSLSQGVVLPVTQMASSHIAPATLPKAPFDPFASLAEPTEPLTHQTSFATVHSQAQAHVPTTTTTKTIGAKTTGGGLLAPPPPASSVNRVNRRK